jgi:hypothetical protein
MFSGFGVVGLLMASLVVSFPAQADDGGVFIDPDAIVATPDEVLAMGSGPEAAAQQQDVWDQMSPSQIEDQYSLREAEGGIEIPPVVATIDPMNNRSARSEVDCSKFTNAYALKPEDSTRKMVCVTSWGTTKLAWPLSVYQRRNGQYTGQLYYSQGNTWYYSAKTNPSMTWYTVYGAQSGVPVTVYAVILIAQKL